MSNKISKSKNILFLISILFICLTMIICLIIVFNNNMAYANQKVNKPSNTGQIHVDGSKLVDTNNNIVVLNGLSTHGLTYCPKSINENLFNKLSYEWNCNLIRLAMYSKDYCSGRSKENLELLHNGINYAINNDMYVIIDWHNLKDSNPLDNLDSAKLFFDNISKEYSNCPNIIYEICNEPNGETTWNDIYKYSNEIIPIIKNNSKNSVIIVGTPDNSKDVMSAASNPLHFNNIMYAFHFYAGTHTDEYRQQISYVINNYNLPIFISEYGITDKNGNGQLYFNEANKWNDFMNKYSLSRSLWSFSNINESSAIFKNYIFDLNNLNTESLSPCGIWARSMLFNENVYDIQYPDRNAFEILYSLRTFPVTIWPYFTILSVLIVVLFLLFFKYTSKRDRKKVLTYDLYINELNKINKHNKLTSSNILKCVTWILLLLCFTLFFSYLLWRILCSIPFQYGWVAVIFNIVLLAVEIVGFCESVIMGYSLLKKKEYHLPKIKDSEFPDVDIFISTYNEPKDLLIKTISACKYIDYPDKNKVHIYVCDDNKRPHIKKLAKEMNVNYLDRDTHEGAKAGNLNHALKHTYSPYIVTFDADMIPKKEFLLNTIPYFVDVENSNKKIFGNRKYKLGFIQTPQNFYQRDIFQDCLYLEEDAPNEQDFFYKTIEPSRTFSNSVIYGGSNTILAREALEKIGGFYTESITEDFATGMLIESQGFITLGLSNPLAHGQTPDNLDQHIQQRIRWGCGVIATRKKIMKLIRHKMSFLQRINYWASSAYWYFPFKYCVYLICPLLFTIFNVFIFDCDIYSLLLYCFPQLILQILVLRLCSKGNYSFVLNNISQVLLTPFTFIPYVREIFGLSLTEFKVTDKSGKNKGNSNIVKKIIPFVIFSLLSVISLIKVGYLIYRYHSPELYVIVFWLILNLYYAIMSIFLIFGRKKDENSISKVEVYCIDDAIITTRKNENFEGIAIHINEYYIWAIFNKKYLEAAKKTTKINIITNRYNAKIKCKFIDATNKKAISIIKFKIEEESYLNEEFLQIIYDRDPSLPVSTRHLNFVSILLKNIHYRLKHN